MGSSLDASVGKKMSEHINNGLLLTLIKILQVVVDCLLPNGVIVPLRCYRESPLDRIKEDLWREARNFPLFELLQDAASYIFVSITQVILSIRIFMKFLNGKFSRMRKEKSFMMRQEDCVIFGCFNQYSKLLSLRATRKRKCSIMKLVLLLVCLFMS